jgi:hypothetical protein
LERDRNIERQCICSHSECGSELEEEERLAGEEEDRKQKEYARMEEIYK